MGLRGLIGLGDLEVSLYNRTWGLRSIPYIIGLGDLEVSLYNRTWGLRGILI